MTMAGATTPAGYAGASSRTLRRACFTGSDDTWHGEVRAGSAAGRCPRGRERMHAHDPQHPDADQQRRSPARPDRVPDRSGPAVTTAPTVGGLTAQRLLSLQRAAGNAGTSALLAERSPVLDVVSGGRGRPLDEPVRSEMEARLGQPFDDVRVHIDGAADASARSVHADAYTVGSDVVFRSGRYDPSSNAGRTLLAHELTHVVQQRSGPVDGTPTHGGISVSDPADRFEREAAANAERAMSGPVPRHAGPTSGATGVQRATGAVTVARQPAPAQSAVPLENADDERIAPADRHGIEIATAGYIPMAFTAFSNATAAHAAAIKNEAKAKAEMIAAVVDVATGFLAPVFANWAVGRMTAKAVAGAGAEVTKKAVVSLISRQDLFKASFTGATKLANQVMKSNANALFGETEVDAFALALRNTFQRGAGNILDHLGSMTDQELIAVWTAYDPANADESAYRHVLKELFGHYQEQVESIGTSVGPDGEGGPGATSGLYEVQLAGRKRLANITAWTSGENNLWAWITPDMEPIARAKSAALGLRIPTIALRDVRVTMAEILDPPRPDLRRRDMLEIARALSPSDRARAAADPDVVDIVEHGRESDGRVPDQYERHKTLYVLRGLSDHAPACVDELDTWFPSASVIDAHLHAADPGERTVLAQDQWFVGALRHEFGGRELTQLLTTL